MRLISSIRLVDNSTDSWDSSAPWARDRAGRCRAFDYQIRCPARPGLAQVAIDMDRHMGWRTVAGYTGALKPKSPHSRRKAASRIVGKTASDGPKGIRIYGMVAA